MDDKRLAVYLCEGCDIGTALDLEALSQICQTYPCKRHPCLCSVEGHQFIDADLQEGTNTLVIGACSPRFKTENFVFPQCIVERVNLREQVVWSHEPNDEDTQMLAQDYLRMGLARAERSQLPEPVPSETSRTILIVGGGAAGLRAARETAKAGYSVVLVEKEAALGGWARKFSTHFPHQPPYGQPRRNGIDQLIEEIQKDARIEVQTNTVVAAIEGQPGEFDVSLRNNGTLTSRKAGAVIQASGWRPYDARKLHHLSYGKTPDIVTNVEMETLLQRTDWTRPSDGSAIKKIAFVQCAGSRDPNHLTYCSAVCCRVSIKQAIQIREQWPDTQVMIFYKDIRTPGQYEDLYRKAQETPGILFSRGDVVAVTPREDGQIRLEIDQTLLGEKILVDADLVVLATGMVPNAVDGEVIRKYTDARSVLDSGETGVKRESAEKMIGELQGIVGESVLNLRYRQGPDTPTLSHGFPDSHFICFPYESRRTAIYPAGCAKAPTDLENAEIDGMGAALKAIQALELSGEGKAVHPRWQDMSYPEFSLQRCTQCKRCTEECPFGALNEDVKGTPKPNPNRCRRCGICLGACPERVISFKDYSIDIISSMIKAVEIPDEFEEKPRLLGLICENDAYPALDTAGLLRRNYSPFIRFIPVRCLGSVNIVWIADALSRGFDGVLLVGCKSGDDYQCHFIRGSEIMATRGKNVREKLTQLALEEERVQIEELSISDYHRLPEVINQFAQKIEEIGLNPFKGF